MARYETTESKRELRVNDIVWAYWFKDEPGKENLNQEPIKGKIVEDVDDTMPLLFVPFKEDGLTIDMNKAIDIGKLNFATREDEVIDAYAELMDKEVEYHSKRIQEITAIKRKFLLGA